MAVPLIDPGEVSVEVVGDRVPRDELPTRGVGLKRHGLVVGAREMNASVVSRAFR